MTSNMDKDYLNRDAAKSMSGMFLGEAKDDSYSTPLSASAEWWKDLQVEDLCIMGAEYEMFVDDIKAWAEIVKVRLSTRGEFPFCCFLNATALSFCGKKYR